MLWLLAFIFTAFPQPTTTPAPASAPVATVDSLIAQLADPDPRVRDSSARQIAAHGESARAALLAASRGGDPRVAPRAANILLSLPWWTDTDPPAVQELLTGFGALDEENRRQIAGKIAAQPGGEAALIRIMREDPSEGIAWTCCNLLVHRFSDPASTSARQARSIDAAHERSAVIIAAARAWLWTDWDKAIQLTRCALEADGDRAPLDREMIDVAFDLVTADAVEHRKFDEAAAWRRRQAHRGGDVSEDGPPSGPLLLFALHGDFGPLAGFDDDLQTFEDDLGRPEVLYAFARMHDRAGQSLLGSAFRQAARSAGFGSTEEHYRAARWLYDRGWTDDSAWEFEATIDSGHALEPARKALIDRLATSEMAQISIESGENGIAVQRLSAAQDAIDKYPRSDAPSISLGSQIHYHEFLAARARSDNAATARALAAMLADPDPDADAASVVVTELRTRGRVDEANSIFNRAFVVQKERVSKFAGEAPEFMAREWNNLAWLCARCGAKPADAIDAAKRATTLTPESAGFWDTAAEAFFASGNTGESVRLELRALSLAPNNPFMKRQLARFEAEAAK